MVFCTWLSTLCICADNTVWKTGAVSLIFYVRPWWWWVHLLIWTCGLLWPQAHDMNISGHGIKDSKSWSCPFSFYVSWCIVCFLFCFLRQNAQRDVISARQLKLLTAKSLTIKKKKKKEEKKKHQRLSNRQWLLCPLAKKEQKHLENCSKIRTDSSVLKRSTLNPIVDLMTGSDSF